MMTSSFPVAAVKRHNGDREFTAYTAALRRTLERGAILSPFVEAAYEPRIHDREVDRNGVRRNSQGMRLTAGLAIDDDPIWDGEVGASLLYRSYEDGSLEDQWVPGLTANLAWQPTDLTRFEFNAGVSLEETITAGQSATKRWSADIAATHALRENSRSQGKRWNHVRGRQRDSTDHRSEPGPGLGQSIPICCCRRNMKQAGSMFHRHRTMANTGLPAA